MGLSSDLISQFVKVTKDDKKTKKETITYGTIEKTIEEDGTVTKYIKLDGSDIRTPLSSVNSSVDVDQGDRVTVMIKNHTTTMTGNLTNPSATYIINSDSNESEKVIDKIVNLEANNTEINEKLYNLESTYGDFVDLTTEKLSAIDADIDNLETNKLNADTAEITYAKISDLDSTTANITSLQSTFGEFKTLTTNNFASVDASIDDLQANKLSASDIEGKYANIDFSNISKATMGEFYANSGLIQNVVVGDSTITGQLVGVTIRGDLIEGNTVKAEKLVIKGSDGLYYKLNTDGVTTEAEQTDENSLNGQIIKSKSITATKISVNDLVAFDATIGGFNITDSAIYSGVKESATNTTRGIYLDNDGQVSFGDSTHFVKYYKDQNGDYKLEISADSMMSKPIFIDGIEFTGKNKVLWSGGWYMTSGHTATLSESISSQANGIVLVFSRYSSSTAQDYNFNTIFVPKSQVANHSGAGHSFIMTTDGMFSVMASKYLYINDTSIVGNDNNNKTGTGASGIVYTNNGFVLRYVIGV